MQNPDIQEKFKKPKIHILLATFNRAHLIGETLDSIIKQTYTNWECIIVDDFSSDNTRLVVEEYQKKDERFQLYLKSKNHKKGLSASRNYGMDLAEKRGAEFIQFFDDDDIMHPRKLELQIYPLIKDDSLDLSICQYRKFTEKETIEFDLEHADDGLCKIETKNLLKSFFLNEINLNSPGPLWRTSKIFNYRFLEELQYAEEREFYLRVFLSESLNYKPIKYVLFWYRKHDKAITANLYEDSSIKQDSLKLFDQYFFRYLMDRKKPPFFLIKSYAIRDIKNQKKEYIQDILNLITRNRSWYDTSLSCSLLLHSFEGFIAEIEKEEDEFKYQ